MVVLVEGRSDAVALHALATRLGRDLLADGVEVVSMGGAKNVRRFLEHYGPHGLDLPVAGLCDAREERDFRRGLERAGVTPRATTDVMSELGFFVCRADLEDELIRALGPEAVESVIETQGELPSLRRLQKQPAQRTRTHHDHLRRFISARSGRKDRYARAFVDALDLDHVPVPLAMLLARV